MEERRIGLTGSTLKLIAIVTMFIDHVGAAIVARILLQYRADIPVITAIHGVMDYHTLYVVYMTLRMIGRIAFPIFCFLLVEGFLHTRDSRKYAMRLGIFALVSEIPFDLAFSSALLEFEYQNVFFTLFLGLLTMMGWDAIEKKFADGSFMRILCNALVLFAGMGAAELLRTDYGMKGVFCIMVLYIFRNKRIYQVIAGCLSFFWWEIAAVLSFIPIYFYNGKRGLKLKYFFYAFYPAHLLLLYLICHFLGIDGVAAV